MRIRRKKNYFVFVLLLLACISIGYAVLNTTLSINGKTSITENTWGVYFFNVIVAENSVEAVKKPTVEDDTKVDFEVALSLPGDFYEFTVDVGNYGTIDAMIDSIEKSPELTDSQKKYFNYTIEYQNGEDITTKQLVKPFSFVRLKVRVEYKKDITASDLPRENETLNLGFIVNYIQSDGTGNEVTTNGLLNKATFNMVSGDLDTPGSEFCLGEECFYVLETVGEEAVALAKYNLYVGSKTTYFDLEKIEYEPLENPTGIQSPLALGFDFKEYKLPSYGGIAFSKSGKTNYEESDIKVFVDNYANYVSSLGYPVFYQGILSKEYLENLGCHTAGGSCSNSDKPWLYSTSYWLEDYHESDSVSGMTILLNTGAIAYSNPDTETGAGVRPVLLFVKSMLTN